jgi:hypothetical protein
MLACVYYQFDKAPEPSASFDMGAFSDDSDTSVSGGVVAVSGQLDGEDDDDEMVRGIVFVLCGFALFFFVFVCCC